MADIGIRTTRAGILAGLITRFLAWLDEPVVQNETCCAHFDERHWDLPVHHPV